MQHFLSFWASYSIAWPRCKRSFVSNNWCLVLTEYRALDSRTRTTTTTRFSYRTTVSARKPASFWREKRATIVILERGFAKMSSVVVLAFFDQEKAQVSATRMTKEGMLLTKSEIKRPGYKSSEYFR